MAQTLRLLIIEDSEDDALLEVRELRNGGFDPVFTRIETLPELEAALDAPPWDAIIADYNLPGFNGLDALRITQARGLDLPFIIVSGVIGEEQAVEAMKAGAHDFIMKGRFARLVPALERELSDAAVRRRRREAEEALRRAHDELENRVRQRTEELEKVNEKLQVEIAERKQTEAALKAANATLLGSRRAALNLMEDAVAAGRRAEETGAELRREVTERKGVEEALRESEESVRRKLDSILAPEGEMGDLDLADIIDARTMQSLMDNFYKLTRMPMGMIDLKGRVLVGVGWQDVCTKFHRGHPETCANCIESDTLLSAGVRQGEFKLYKCKNNMWDVATPIMVGDKQFGNFFMGQFLFEDEPVDYEFFRSQARQYGFAEEEYIACLESVPRLSRETLATGMAYFSELAEMISRMSYSNLKLARSLAERDSLMDSLRQSEERLNRAQEMAQLGSWELDLVNNRLSWSDEVYRIFGLRPQEFGATYEAFLEAIHPDDRAAVDAAYSGSLRERRDSYEIEHRIVRKSSGEIRIVQEKCEHFRDSSGQVIRSVGMVHDITKRKRDEESLRQAKEAAEAANRAKRQFLANMSHELRTPMTGVLGTLDIALSGPLDPQQRELLCVAHKSARSLLRILNDILDLTKVEAGILSMEEKPFTLRDCIGGAVEILIPEARRKGLDLIRPALDDLPQTVVGDQLRLRQVLTNLIGNAVKFTEQGQVAVRVEAGDKTADGKWEFIFTVTDTGIGIPADKQHLLFRSFSQVDDSDTRGYGGAGLGLAISREIAQRLGGTISFESEEGVGSTFTFTVPLGEYATERETAPEAATEEPAASPALLPVSGPKPRLLIAEDDPITRKVIGMMLQRSNYELDVAKDGQQAVEMWEKGGYDLILMDMQMPRMDGFEATRAIREKERERGGHVPIVALTAHALKEDEERCLAAGMDSYIAKPIDFRKCLQLIGELIGK